MSRRRWGDAFWSGHWWIPVATVGAVVVVSEGIWIVRTLRSERHAAETACTSAAEDEGTLHERLMDSDAS